MALHKNLAIGFSEFAGENEGLIRTALDPYFPPAGNDYDDLHQAGMIGLWKANEKYEPGKGAFSTFAINIIRRDVIDMIRRSNAGSQQLLNESSSLDQTTDDREIATRHEQIPDHGAFSVEGRVILRDWIRDFTEGLQELPKFASESAFKVWIAGFTTNEVGDQHGRKQSAVKTALYKIRHETLPDYADLPFVEN